MREKNAKISFIYFSYLNKKKQQKRILLKKRLLIATNQ